MRASLITLLDDWRNHAEETAVVTYRGNRRKATTYGTLLLLAGNFAAELDRRGIGAGERVLLWGQNSAEWIAVFFGCMLRGALVVPLDAAGSIEFTHRVLAETSPRLIVADEELLRNLDPLSPVTDTLSFHDIPSLPERADTPSPIAITRETPLQIIFTSGTTSEPKGIVHTHGNVLASVEPIETEIEKYRRYERPFHPLRFLHTLPLSHVFGQFMGLWLPPLLGAEVHFESRLEADRLVHLLRRRRISVLVAVPRLLELLQAYLLEANPSLLRQTTAARSLPLWRRILHHHRIHRTLGWKFWAFVCGGAALPADLEIFWNTLGYAVIQGYGMTETTALITLNHPFRTSRGKVGAVLPGRQIRISPEGEISVRGEMVSTATWQGGTITPREDPWLRTGDLVAQDTEGNLQFVGRRSEVIVTSAGLNLHPEDLEAELMREQAITACAVINVENQPVAIVVAPGGPPAAAAAIASANRRLAEFQRIRHWRLWPDADLPRSSTGKIQRARIATWAVHQQTALDQEQSNQTSDPLVALIASLTASRPPQSVTDETTLDALGLDSLGRLQLQNAVEQRFNLSLSDESLAAIQTLGQLRAITQRSSEPPPQTTAPEAASSPQTNTPLATRAQITQSSRTFHYPQWPWTWPVRLLRMLFLEAVLRPIVWLLLKPRVESVDPSLPAEPMLLIANHVTAFDAALVLYALPPRLRRRVAIASAGEMIEDWRRGRNQPHWWQNLLAPAEYWLLVALFNIFPLPRQAGFRSSLLHIGEALDRGYNVLIFPEGTRSPQARLLPFRSGIGVVARESQAPILPVALRGMDALVTRTRRRWFHSGLVSIRTGSPVTLTASQPAEDLTRTLEAAMRGLLR